MLRYGERRNDSKCTLPSIATVKYSHNIKCVLTIHNRYIFMSGFFFLEKIFNLLKKVALVQKKVLLFPIMISILFEKDSYVYYTVCILWFWKEWKILLERMLSFIFGLLCTVDQVSDVRWNPGLSFIRK